MRGARQLIVVGFCFLAMAAETLAGEEHVPSIDNHELFWKALNFAILVGALGYLLKKPIQLFFRSRREGIAKEIEEVRRARDEAIAKLREIEKALEKTDAEKEAIQTAAKEDAKAARDRLIEAARSEAEKIRSSAKFELARTTEQSRRELRNYAAKLYTETAEELIRQDISPEDEDRLRKSFLDRLAGGEAA